MKAIRRPNHTKTERNESLIKDYNKGASIVSMVSKYQISSTRIYKLLKLSKSANHRLLKPTRGTIGGKLSGR